MEDKKINYFVILKGVFGGVILLLLLGLILALVTVHIYSMNNVLLNRVLLIISLLVVLFVGFNIARKVSDYGWLNGGLGGIFFMMIIILLGSININFSFWPVFLILLLGMVFGAVGGIIGINFSNSRNNL